MLNQQGERNGYNEREQTVHHGFTTPTDTVSPEDPLSRWMKYLKHSTVKPNVQGDSHLNCLSCDQI